MIQGSVGFSRGAVVTGVATAPSFDGALTGNVTGNVSGSSGSCTGNAATAQRQQKQLLLNLVVH